jgi:hypothetical protein
MGKGCPTRISRTLGCLVISVAASASLTACKDAVTGEGSNLDSLIGVQVEATSGVSGANPTGTIHFGIGLERASWSGEVSCLSVRGNTAIIGFGNDYFWQPPIPFVPKTYWVTGLVRIVDNGPGPGDTFEYVELQTGPHEEHLPPPTGDPLPGPTECSSFPDDRTVYVMTNEGAHTGGFKVNDALPLRASKD